ncbi:MAG TPA: pyridoxal 5'-phosphate synthase glutaminase subunit PdxT [Acidimicrobiales bacterium]|nr:pyridoxal 5'-phosphate synthase glutaminase subunit PdxT [Acidimicrobiales bacterium]
MEPAATVGVLALQGDVLEHEAAFAEVGVATRRVRRSGDLDGIDGLVLPGGESTTLSMLLESSDLFDPIAQRIAGGLATFGTCAGLILLARRVEDGRPDQRSFAALDCAVRRNGYGPQRFSFEGEAEPVGDALGAAAGPLPAIFIRAPLVTEVWGGAEILAVEGSDGHPVPVVLRQGHVLAATFHPELTADRRLQRLFAGMVRERRAGAPGAQGEDPSGRDGEGAQGPAADRGATAPVEGTGSPRLREPAGPVPARR